MDVLAARRTDGFIQSGSILYNGELLEPEQVTCVSAYVQMDFAFTAELTVREHLVLSATMRGQQRFNIKSLRGKDSEAGAHNKVLKYIIQLLELNNILDMQFGRPFDTKGRAVLTIEQAKRVAIAAELVSQPRVMFLDEPTTGVDSYTAHKVIGAIVGVLQSHMTVVLSIQRPSYRMLEQFAHIMMLHAGEMVYFGGLGDGGKAIVKWFESIPHTPKCPVNKTPVAYAFELLKAEPRTIQYSHEYMCSSNYLEVARTLRAQTIAAHHRGRTVRPNQSLYDVGFFTQARVLMWVMVTTHSRAGINTYGRLVFVSIFAVILGSAYYNVEINSSSGSMTGAGCYYISVYYIAGQMGLTSIVQNMEERPVFRREISNEMYSVTVYNLCKSVAEVPFLLGTVLVFTSISVPMTGILGDHRPAGFFEVTIVLFLLSMTYSALGEICALMNRSILSASIPMSLLTFMWSQTVGFTIGFDDIPDWWTPFEIINPLTYALKLCVAVVFYCDTSDSDNDCEHQEDLSDAPYVYDEVSDQYEAHYGSRGWYYLGLIMSLVIARTLAAIATRNFAIACRRQSIGKQIMQE